jgi:hypothetical protein
VCRLDSSLSLFAKFFLPEVPAPDLLRAKRRRRVTRPTHDMLGDYLTALLVAVLGYIYPVYLCFKVSR